ncbi:hypothetical protein [Flagellimonas flava]|uniref:hypothetical protein n=1 Tax=Flagellimonas flava TaxID=570519 RepID=UPI003D65FB1F
MTAVAFANKGLKSYISKSNPMAKYVFATHNYSQLSTVKKALDITCDQESVEASKSLLKALKELVSSLPEGDSKMKNSDWLKLHKESSSAYQELEGFLSFFDDYTIEGNAKKVVQNLKLAKEHIKFTSDYAQLIINSYKDISELSSKKSKIYSLDALKQELGIS